MPKKVTTEIFIEIAKAKHEDKYDYSESVYTKSKEKLIIKCPIHGAFEQMADTHLQGGGCYECGNKASGKKLASNLDNFREKANAIHDFKYNYSKAVYKSARNKLEIVCLVHGSFFQTPDNHLQGRGCYKCGRDLSRKKQLKNQEEWVEEANKTHNFRYDYTNSIYTGADNLIIIRCLEHGLFEQVAFNHSKGHGCSKCNRLGGIGITKEAFIEQANKKYDGKAKLYLIHVYDEEESFLKIGITMLPIYKRFSKNGNTTNLPYSYTVLNLLEADAAIIYETEKMIHKQYKDQKYIPSKKFGGMYECFKLSNGSYDDNMQDIKTHFGSY